MSIKTMKAAINCDGCNKEFSVDLDKNEYVAFCEARNA